MRFEGFDELTGWRRKALRGDFPEEGTAEHAVAVDQWTTALLRAHAAVEGFDQAVKMMPVASGARNRAEETLETLLSSLLDSYELLAANDKDFGERVARRKTERDGKAWLQ
jgi:hypothetical protein